MFKFGIQAPVNTIPPTTTFYRLLRTRREWEPHSIKHGQLTFAFPTDFQFHSRLNSALLKLSDLRECVCYLRCWWVPWKHNLQLLQSLPLAAAYGGLLITPASSDEHNITAGVRSIATLHYWGVAKPSPSSFHHWKRRWPFVEMLILNRWSR